ncbi:hypothetical protein [uncultured Porphyromonas sp.]|uniref:hypothetical protein n=1 Tax=uncultured Porphyromonas sp. TaxID=159274 RepID=UPI00260F157D|nr:hypothetical protein [uncultured Porphyromonas sp.]
MQRQLNYLLAYRGETAIRRVLSTEEAVYNVNMENQIPYTPTDRLRQDENEWFYIEGFRESGFNTAIAKIGGADIKIEELFERLTEFTEFQSTDYPGIKWLITKQGECYYFQKVLPSSRIENRTILMFVVGAPRIKEMSNSVEVRRGFPDIIYDSHANRLLFRDLSRAKEIYKDLINLYREATDEEITDFLSSREDTTISISRDKIGIRNRKEIARLGDKISTLSSEAKAALVTYIDTHLTEAGLHKGEDGKIIIAKPKDLSSYLALLDQRFVHSEVYSERRKITAFTKA